MPGTPGALVGLRLGIVRESMVLAPGAQTEVPIVTAAAREIKMILGDRLGATLVESSHPLWSKDLDVETMQTDFRRALARLVPVFMPELLFRLGPDGQPLFKEFAAAIVPTEFMPGKIFGTGAITANRLFASSWRRNGLRPLRTSISLPSRSRNSRWRSDSISRNT